MQAEDLQKLLNALVNVAHSLLAEHGEFPPAGATVDDEGKLSFVKPYEGEGQEEPARQVALLEATFREHALENRCRSSAFCLDVTAQRPGEDEGTDAILVSIEHETGEAMDVFVPYSLLPELELGQPFGTQRDPRVFVSDGEVN